MSLWAEYIRELRGPDFRQFLEYPDCFAVYSVPEGKDCIIIHDMYVRPDLRKSGRGKALLADIEDIGRKAGRTCLLAELELGTLSVQTAFRAQTAVGFQPISAYNGIIAMRKEIT